ncbi:type II toxin-antitoxin system antitoxin, RelB/DinJ family [Streptococcus iniae]|nr:type II toxin-antitoxin system antitoxin, RelB/DinJ family [Streptococcus iniae]RMI76881.1 type II toxin-antitoxin system antitoxin, RelB/DinJ family [Streptococcus iniae]HEK4517178.1 type II toxin-antitoxin system RelB/DinJ family antitoxin [Streptococcus iniae]
MSSAVKIFLKQIIITQSIPFDIKLNNDFKLDTQIGGSEVHIRTRDITEYNEETQASYKQYMDQYKKEGINPTDES